jgi:hypothetical protein
MPPHPTAEDLDRAEHQIMTELAAAQQDVADAATDEDRAAAAARLQRAKADMDEMSAIRRQGGPCDPRDPLCSP